VEGQIGCDWKRTLAFAPYGQLSGCLFVNQDLAETASERERAVGEIIEVCRNARDPETSQPLFQDIFSVADRYGFDPEEHGMPDVLALSADGYQAQAKWPLPFGKDVLRPDPGLPATHWFDGIVAIDGPSIRPGDHLQADLHDIAPTALAMLGLDVPENMEGRVLQDAFAEPLPVRIGPMPDAMADPDGSASLVALAGGAESP
jgi:predicted AlkP superfamily phosphohydrolase/phosphomutase